MKPRVRNVWVVKQSLKDDVFGLTPKFTAVICACANRNFAYNFAEDLEKNSGIYTYRVERCVFYDERS